MRRLCVGDIHGCYDKLLDVLDRCKFSDSDILYSVGDFTDRGKQNVQVLGFIRKLKNFFPVCGNHDLWNYEYLHPYVPHTTERDNGKIITYKAPYMTRNAFECWYDYNGGRNTVNEEKRMSDEWKANVYDFLKNIPYRINLGDKIIIHSVCPSSVYKWVEMPLDEIRMETLKSSGLIMNDVYDENVWNRQVINGCSDYTLIGDERSSYDIYFKKHYCYEFSGNPIYIIGHTPLDHPFFDRELGIIGIDTGAFCNKEKYGVDGHLTVLDIDAFEYWQSDRKGSFQL